MVGRNLRVLEGELAPPVEDQAARRVRLAPDGGESLAPPLVRADRRALQPVRVDGKFFRSGAEKWFVRGVSYGPFAPDDSGLFLPARDRVRGDFDQIAQLGGNAVRVYHVPPRWLLDEAAEAGLHVLVDVPWEKHRCFLEDYEAQRRALEAVRGAAGELGA